MFEKPLIKILASPSGNNFFSATPSKITRIRTTREKTNMDDITVVSNIIY